MPSKTPELIVWDTCCILGVLNEENDKLPGLLSEIVRCESGRAYLGIPSTAISEIVTLANGLPADSAVEEFLNNTYVQTLQAHREVGQLAGRLQFRFQVSQMPDLKEQALKFGCPPDQAKRLRRADSEVLATAIVYKATRLTTYDPFLKFIGRE